MICSDWVKRARLRAILLRQGGDSQKEERDRREEFVPKKPRAKIAMANAAELGGARDKPGAMRAPLRRVDVWHGLGRHIVVGVRSVL
jgi:hypothetical protein